jgi:hypothetical protein
MSLKCVLMLHYMIEKLNSESIYDAYYIFLPIILLTLMFMFTDVYAYHIT